MLALLLAAAVTVPPSPVTPQVEIAFPNAASITVTGPENSAKNAEYPWTHQQTLLSPRGDAAVRFCWEIGKYDGCQVYLARPGQPTLRLKNSGVKRLLWTADGRYLIGAGANTVRLWNLVGGVRTAVPQPAVLERGLTAPASTITRLWLDASQLCVAMQTYQYQQKDGSRQMTVTTTRYTLPVLKPLTVTTLGMGPNEKAKEAECRPFTSSDLWP